MKHLLAMICLATILTACSAAPQTRAAMPGNVPAENHAAASATTPPVNEVTLLPTMATDLPLTETNLPPSSMGNSSTAEATQPPGTLGASPKVIKVQPPHIPIAVTPGAIPTIQAGWQSYTSQLLKVSVNYPADWKVEEQADSATFGSSAGDLIHLQAAGSSQNADLQCNTLINSYGLKVQACFEAGTNTYSAEFSLAANPGLSQPVLLSTTSQGGLDVYRGMLNSLHPAP
ncbi:MAG TPA: hypothetical protein VMT91_03470 [Anaerolineales bacterium]|nr:hypothetical protein [Anaerolineales bacterium]